MKIEALLGLGIPVLFLLMLLVEARAPARTFVARKGWRWLGVAFFVLTLVLSAITPKLLPLDRLQALQWLALADLGLWGVPIGLLATTFAGYWLHRAEHRFRWLWLATHQLHHSPPRVDMAGAYFAHPFEVMLKATLGTTVSSVVLGLTPLASTLVGLSIAALSLFQHWNIRTPRLLGYFVQRPESHCVHHARGDRGHNFSELPLWDMVFGTFSNPATFRGEVGLDAHPAPPLAHMLLMRGARR
ncbi:MAG: sterol desaturase family protein [Burkholderiales bacterium]|nr:sterol desaturase family protein [Burkholderiales bacterium]